MGLRRFDERVVRGQYLSFEDKGKVSKGAVTNKFAVFNRIDRSFIGWVKFKGQWRQYVFFPLNCILNRDCLREVANFCEELTTAWREERKPFPVSVEKQVVEDDSEDRVAPVYAGQ